MRITGHKLAPGLSENPCHFHAHIAFHAHHRIHLPGKTIPCWGIIPVETDVPVGLIGLSGDAVSEVIRERLAAIGIDTNGYSGHSLRAGFATSAARAGVSTLKIRAQTGHASDAMLNRYIRDGNLFTENATAALL